MRSRFGIGILLGLLGPVCAQQSRGSGAGEPTRQAPPAPQSPAPQSPAPQRTVEDYSEAASRELFRGCDADGDDRLDLFEAHEALDTLGDPTEAEAFLRLDRNRDGYLVWPEFDARYRAAIDREGSFRVRTCRRITLVETPAEATPSNPLQQFLQLYDQNRNGGLDPTEVDELVRQAGLQPSFGSLLKALDKDQSGRIEEAELAPWFDEMRGLLPVPRAEAAAKPQGLAAPWGAVDRNGDGHVDVEELTRMLLRIDPSLARWAAQLLRARDRNQDGRLGADELPVPPAIQPRETASAGLPLGPAPLSAARANQN